MSKKLTLTTAGTNPSGDPYPDTGETGETYDQELAHILDAIKNRISPIVNIRAILLTSLE